MMNTDGPRYIARQMLNTTITMITVIATKSKGTHHSVNMDRALPCGLGMNIWQ